MTATEPIFLGPAPIVEPGPDVSQRLARLISNVFSPPGLAIPLMVLAARESGDPSAWRDMAIYAAIAVLLPMADLVWRLHAGHIDDIHLPNRSDRRRAFLGGILCTSLALAVLVHLQAASLIVGVASVTLLQAVVLFLITLCWQVSVHSAAAASLVGLSAILLGPRALLVVPVLPAVSWARLHLDRHTPAQVVVGAAIGLSGVLLLLLVW
jgi:hypothetical protein